MVPGVEFRAISKAFGGTPVLREVTFSIARGRTVGLLGENGAGKSTLMNLLGGNLQPDSGEIWLEGAPHRPDSAAAAAANGVAFVHQELNLFPNLSIAENLFLTDFPRRTPWPFIDRSATAARARALLTEVGLSLSPDTRVDQLSAGQCQLVEIARALGQNARVLILDEPTTSLGARETATLFGLLQRLRERGLTVIYISHILDDVRRLCDDVVVLRDGVVAGQGPLAEFSNERLIALMVGRSLDRQFPIRAGAATNVPLLRVAGLTEPGVTRDVSFVVQRGEILGLSGLMGAGRSELARIIFGLDPRAAGSIELDRRLIETASVQNRIEAGLGFLTEDRRQEGLCMAASIADNLALVTLRQHAARVGWLRRSAMTEAVRAMAQSVRLSETTNLGRAVRTLSGGNQQKVILGKWLLAQPRVLILDEPTRGVDVGARFELYQLILRAADAGCGILLISSDLEELIGLCDRILVLRRGEIHGEFTRARFDREKLLAAALPDGKDAA